MENVSYLIVLEPADEGGYTVTVPALPPVVTEGDTYEEAIEMAKDAIGLYLKSLVDAGLSIPVEKPPVDRTSVLVQIASPVGA